MNTVSRRTLVRATAVTACAAGLLALPTGAAVADAVPVTSTSAVQRTLVKSVALADGRSTARVYRIAKNAYQADILRSGTTVATLTSRDGFTGFGNTGELHAALRPDGRLSSWVGDTGPEDGSHLVAGDGHKTGTRGGTHVTPVSDRGPVGTADTLRLNTLADGPGEGVLLLAAGGGIAAIGAAGLGFAMLRRGRTDG
ncbi:hypothetical protein [Streptomyces sp. NPDC048606]|uniref:hypothetical protein n=1 Tax=Streptomyces sp. NPDC048606 TaxID=3154726 RepID=UPI00343D0BB3